MKFDLLIAKFPKKLILDDKLSAEPGSFPESWVWVDRLSQGLISRFLWSKSVSKKTSNPYESEKSDWILLQPFAPISPIVLAIWNSEDLLDMESLDFDRNQIQKIYYDPESIEGDDLKKAKKAFSSIKTWDRGKSFPSLIAKPEISEATKD